VRRICDTKGREGSKALPVLIAVRALDYKHAFSERLSIGGFLGAARLDLATPAYGYWLGGALEYLGELYVETGQIDKAKENVVLLKKLCPDGCKELTELEQSIAGAAPKTN